MQHQNFLWILRILVDALFKYPARFLQLAKGRINFQSCVVIADVMTNHHECHE